MRSHALLGLVLLLAGLFLLYLLRGILLNLVLLVLGILGILLAFGLIAGGLALMFWSRRW